MSFSNELVKLENVEVNAKLIRDIARVDIKQTFTNANNEAVEAIYAFPVWTDASLCKCNFDVDGRTITCKINEKNAAKKDYDDAVDQGKQAVFASLGTETVTMNVGNIEKGKPIIVTLSYVTRVKEDLGYAEGGYRLIIPMTISQNRYGAPNTKLEYSSSVDRNVIINIEVDSAAKILKYECVNKAGCAISVENGNLKVTYAQKDIALNSDFVFLYSIEGNHCIVEELDNAPVALYSYVDLRKLDIYKEATKAAKPACYIFIVDQSGSMGGAPMEHAKNATKIMLNSLNRNCMFNVYGFGSSYWSIFAEPVKATEDTMQTAISKVSSMAASLGGTEIRSVLEHVYSTIGTQETFVYIMTDGEVWDLEGTLDVVKKYKHRKNVITSTLGIGSTVSHALTEGISKYGGGGSQYAMTSEDIESKAMELFKRTTVLRAFTTKIIFGRHTKTIKSLLDMSFIRFLTVKDIPDVVKIIIGAYDKAEEIVIPVTKVRDYAIHCIAAKSKIDKYESKDQVNKVVELSKKYNVLSKYTAFVGVSDDDLEIIEDEGKERAQRRSVVIPMKTTSAAISTTTGAFIVDGGTGIGGRLLCSSPVSYFGSPSVSLINCSSSSSARFTSLSCSTLSYEPETFGSTRSIKSSQPRSRSISLSPTVVVKSSKDLSDLTKKDIIDILGMQSFNGLFKKFVLKDVNIEEVTARLPQEDIDVLITCIILSLMTRFGLDTEYSFVYNKAENAINPDLFNEVKTIVLAFV